MQYQTKRKKIFNILKLCLAILILYFGLTINVYDIGEKLDISDSLLSQEESKVQDQLDQEIKDAVGKHQASIDLDTTVYNKLEEYDGTRNEYKIKFQNTCLSNISFCAKIKFEGDFTYKQKYMYLASTMYILKNIQQNIVVGKDLKDQLDKIIIKDTLEARRGYATWDEIVINLGMVKSYSEFFELIGHEIGHVVDLGIIKGFNSKKSAIFTEFDKKVFSIDDPSIAYYGISWKSEKVRKSDAKKDDFCSAYGMTDPFEDFAECHNLYLNHNAIFKKRAKENDNMKKKYNFMANLYGGSYLFDMAEDFSYSHSSTWRPWDTTRM